MSPQTEEEGRREEGGTEVVEEEEGEVEQKVAAHRRLLLQKHYKANVGAGAGQRGSSAGSKQYTRNSAGKPTGRRTQQTCANFLTSAATYFFLFSFFFFVLVTFSLPLSTHQETFFLLFTSPSHDNTTKSGRCKDDHRRGVAFLRL